VLLVDLATNVLGNVVFWVLVGVLALGSSRMLQRRVYAFFGVPRGGRVTVFVSNAWRPAPGSDTTQGYALSLHELRGWQTVEAFFGSAPLRLPELARGLVDAVWLREQITTDLVVSTPQPQTTAGTEIVIGSARRNHARRAHLEAGRTRAWLGAELEGPPMSAVNRVHVAHGGGTQTIESDLQIAVLERYVDAATGRTVFYCHGNRADGSRAAVEYLARHWKRLAARHGGRSFVVLLGCSTRTPYPEHYEEPTLLASVDDLDGPARPSL
jgi:hypothetical protein